jgi:hypothetical protein
VSQSGDKYSYENDAFVRQVVSGDWGHNPSSFSDATGSLELTLACAQAVSQSADPTE